MVTSLKQLIIGYYSNNEELREELGSYLITNFRHKIHEEQFGEFLLKITKCLNDKLISIESTDEGILRYFNKVAKTVKSEYFKKQQNNTEWEKKFASTFGKKFDTQIHEIELDFSTITNKKHLVLLKVMMEEARNIGGTHGVYQSAADKLKIDRKTVNRQIKEISLNYKEEDIYTIGEPLNINFTEFDFEGFEVKA